MPYPTLAQEIRAMNGDLEVSPPEEPPDPKVRFVSITFAPGTHISQNIRDRIVFPIKAHTFYDGSERSWLQEIQDVGVKGALQDAGYLKATVRADAHLLTSTPRLHRYALTLHIEEGLQYRLGDVHINSADPDKSRLVFPESELRQLLHLRRGDLFNVSKIRAAMQDITNLYRTNGYIDMVPSPEEDIDDDPSLINLVFRIDEGKQYRVGKIEFLGLDEATQAQLQPKLNPGDIYNGEFVNEILKRNKSILPSDASERDVRATRNTKYGIVNLRFDFYSCP